jgi:chlorite dismutase
MKERYDNQELGAPLPELSSELYTCYASFSAPAARWLTVGEREAAISEFEQVLEAAPATLRGGYSLQGFRADADLLFWFTGESAEAIQDSIVQLRQTRFGRTLDQWWTSMGVHRDSEFNRSHVPSYALGLTPKTFVSVYPYVRSLDWYLLPAEERRDMLAEHGRMGRAFPGIQPNTVPSFGMGDYEWLLALETDDLTELLDMMRELRAAGARRHTKEEIPFLVGRLLPLRELIEQLPVAIERELAPA